MEHGKDLRICLVDYEKACNRLDWTLLMAALKRLEIDWRERRLIESLYTNQKAVV